MMDHILQFYLVFNCCVYGLMMADCGWNRYLLTKTQLCWAEPCACCQLWMAKKICVKQWHNGWKCERRRFTAIGHDTFKPLKH